MAPIRCRLSCTASRRYDDGPIYPVRTITIGHYKFLAKGPDEGAMVRYTQENDAVVFYELDSKAAWLYLEKNFPDQDDFYRGDPDDSREEMDASDDPLRISALNSNAAKIIATIPDNEKFWDPDTLIKKAK